MKPGVAKFWLHRLASTWYLYSCALLFWILITIISPNLIQFNFEGAKFIRGDWILYLSICLQLFLHDKSNVSDTWNNPSGKVRATGWPGRGGRDGTRVIWGYSKFRIAWDDFDSDMLLIFPLELPDVRTAADNCIAVALLVKFFSATEASFFWKTFLSIAVYCDSWIWDSFSLFRQHYRFSLTLCVFPCIFIQGVKDIHRLISFSFSCISISTLKTFIDISTIILIQWSNSEFSI